MYVGTLTVYCGSSNQVSGYLQAACDGRGNRSARLRLAYGAGCTGLMGAVADGAAGRRQCWALFRRYSIHPNWFTPG
jgi:predicted Rossmann-fold nucleotide-binding protein